MNKFNVSLPIEKNVDFNTYLLKNIEKKPKFIFLIGELGSGKTTFVKYLSKLLGETAIINSPSFNYIKVYEKIVHIDAYNLHDGIEEYEDFFDDKIIIVEWANRINYLAYDNSLVVKINYTSDNNTREFEIERK